MSLRRTYVPNTPLGRRQRIAELLATTDVQSQGQLQELLAGDGLRATQATLSRDLEDLRAIKIRNDAGVTVYKVPHLDDDQQAWLRGDQVASEERLARACEELLLSAEAAANLVVVRTPVAGAQFLSSTLDHVNIDSIVGTVSGDDAFLVVTRNTSDAEELVSYLIRLAEGSRNQTNSAEPGAAS